MNDEIREIEEWLKDISTPTGLSYSGDRTLSNSMVDKIIDYITNLQQENENIKEKAKNYLDIYEEMFDYKSRVEKTTEKLSFIDEALENDTLNVPLCIAKINSALNILQNGSDEK